MKLEKVYDELYGMIEDLKKKIAAISSGNAVSITPTLESGVKVADYTIGKDTGSLYAPIETAGVYSSAKTKIGTWTDGSDLYRKVITAAITGTSDTVSLVDDITADDELLFFEFFVTTPSYVVMGGFNGSNPASGDTLNAYYDIGNNRLSFYDTLYTGTATIMLYYHEKSEVNSKNRRKK